jgi:hypothetical protein
MLNEGRKIERQRDLDQMAVVERTKVRVEELGKEWLADWTKAKMRSAAGSDPISANTYLPALKCDKGVGVLV